MRAYLLFFFCLLLLVPSGIAPPAIKDVTVSGGNLIISSNIPVAIPQNKTHLFEIHILNVSKLIVGSASCYLHVYDESGTGDHLYVNSSSTFNSDYDVAFSVPPEVHLKKGFYSFKALCNTTNEAGIFEKSYYVTRSGIAPAEDIFSALIYLMFIFATVGLFYTFFLTIAKLATAESTIFDVLVSWSFIILMIIVSFLAQEYLIRTFVEDLSSTFITLTIYTNGVLPLISFIITFFIKGTKKKKVPSVGDVSGRYLS